MALKDGQAVTVTPVDVFAGVGLVAGTKYRIQNTGHNVVDFMELATAPDPAVVAPQFLEHGDIVIYTPKTDNPMWAWTRQNKSHLAVNLFILSMYSGLFL